MLLCSGAPVAPMAHHVGTLRRPSCSRAHAALQAAPLSVRSSHSAVPTTFVHRRGVLLAGAALVLLQPARSADALPTPESNPEPLGDGMMRFYGRATSSSSYGGYGGNDTNYRYYFDLPDTWKTDTVSKVDKATNGTDVRYVNPAQRDAKVYVTSFNGYPTLKEDRRSLINDLALSDSSLQDALSYADDVIVSERTEEEQLYVDFDIISGGRTIYATVTSDGARLYALFCIGATSATDELYRKMRSSLRSIK